MSTSIEVRNVAKVFKRYASPRQRLLELMWPQRQRHSAHWALQGINFSAEQGESFGIVGMNGAGKSTLLKLVAGTMKPTQGDIFINGSVSALLELGMGFHPEFSGRENVIMAGQLMGLKLPEIHELMEAIEDFAEIGDFIDQPLRTYSSGMQVRLAFSVATVKRPDVLIVDEALSVGDAYFQQKSFSRIQDMKRQGTTLLIVSHDRGAIQSICDKALLLRDGLLAVSGRPEDVMDYYNALLAEHEQQTVQQTVTDDGVVQTVSGSGEIGLIRMSLQNSAGQPLEVVPTGEPVALILEAEVHQAVDQLVLGFMIKDRLGQSIYGINTSRLNRILYDLKPGEKVRFRFDFPMNLGKGSYSIATSLSRSDSHLEKNYEWRDRGLMFHVVDMTSAPSVGVAWLNAQVDIERD